MISIQCDTTAPADVAVNKDILYIGYGVDMKSHDKDHCLASIVWNLKAYYTAALTSVSNGTWAQENFCGNLANGAVTLSSVSGDTDPLLTARIDSASYLIKKGFFEIFSNHVLEFDSEGNADIVRAALIDNNSNIMISEDGSEYYLYSGEELKSIDPAAVTTDNLASANMNYLVDGVTVRE